jgi:nitric oxide synthase-interacting protein
MKNLIPVKFTFFNGGGTSRSVDSTPADGSEKARREDADPICPSCKKKLSNSSLMYGTLSIILYYISASLIIGLQ